MQGCRLLLQYGKPPSVKDRQQLLGTLPQKERCLCAGLPGCFQSVFGTEHAEQLLFRLFKQERSLLHQDLHHSKGPTISS